MSALLEPAFDVTGPLPAVREDGAALLAPAVSANVLQKTGRGRPRSLSPEVERMLVEIWPELTPRARREEALFAQVLAVLWPSESDPDWLEPKFEYLWNRGTPRKTILVALGRLEDPERIRKAAAVIAENRVPAPVVLARLRVLRLGRDVDRVAGLTTALLAAATNYKRAHSELTDGELESALLRVLDAFAEVGALAGGADRKRLAEPTDGRAS